MRKVPYGLAVLALVAGACVGDAADNGEASTPETARVVVGDEPGYVPPDWPEPLVAVAVGDDDLPVVMFYDMLANVIEYRRCIDPGCKEPPTAAQIELPDDLDLGWLQLTVDPSGLPLGIFEGSSIDDEGVGGPPLFYLGLCGDVSCSTMSWARFDSEQYPNARFSEEGSLVLASTTAENPEEPSLVLRRCSDSLCHEATRAEIPVLPHLVRWEVFVDPMEIPVAVAGGGALDSEEGFVAVIACTDAICSDHETYVTDAPHHMSRGISAAGELPVVFAGSSRGVTAVTWPGSIADASISVTIDSTSADDHQFATALSMGWGENPVAAYLRTVNLETDDETRQLVVAECSQADCSTGTLTEIAHRSTELGLETNPSIAVAPNGDPIIAFHTCPPGCSPQYINILRCPGGCAQAFPDRVEATWEHTED